jgi:hypothetical protein
MCYGTNHYHSYYRSACGSILAQRGSVFATLHDGVEELGNHESGRQGQLCEDRHIKRAATRIIQLGKVSLILRKVNLEVYVKKYFIIATFIALVATAFIATLAFAGDPGTSQFDALRVDGQWRYVQPQTWVWYYFDYNADSDKVVAD